MSKARTKPNTKAKPIAKAREKAEPATKTKAQESYETGLNLENRVAKWLTSQFGYEVKKRDLVRGLVSKRPYEMDVHGIKKQLFGLSKYHLWVECKAYKIKRAHLTKLVESARDVKEFYENDHVSWKPDMLMLVSTEGFDIDALGLAKRYSIYCVTAGKAFTFEGKMDKSNLENLDGSDY